MSPSDAASGSESASGSVAAAEPSTGLQVASADVPADQAVVATGWMPKLSPKPENVLKECMWKLTIPQLKMLLKVYGGTTGGTKKETFVDGLRSFRV